MFSNKGNLKAQPRLESNYPWQFNLYINSDKPIINKGSVQFNTQGTELKSNKALGYGIGMHHDILRNKYSISIGFNRSVWQYEVSRLHNFAIVNCPLSMIDLFFYKKINLKNSFLSIGTGTIAFAHLKTQAKEYKTWFNGINSAIVYTRVKNKFGYSVGFDHKYMPIKGKYDGVFELYNDGYNWPVETRFQSIGLKTGVSYFLK